jgi:hypothetical protein
MAQARGLVLGFRKSPLATSSRDTGKNEARTAVDRRPATELAPTREGEERFRLEVLVQG